MLMLILVVGKNVLASRQLGYWEGVRYSGWGNISWGKLSRGEDILLHRMGSCRAHYDVSFHRLVIAHAFL